MRRRSEMKYKVYKDKAGEWRWRLVAANGRTVADSGEGYHNKADCLAGIELVKGSKNAPVEEE
jgi:uncharacterized protein YegP (UPF0339 family)